MDTGGTLTNIFTTTTIQVTIRDVDDNPPRFSTDVYNVQVTETSLNGTVPGLFFGVSDRDEVCSFFFRFQYKSVTQ